MKAAKEKSRTIEIDYGCYHRNVTITPSNRLLDTWDLENDYKAKIYLLDYDKPEGNLEVSVFNNKGECIRSDECYNHHDSIQEVIDDALENESS